MRFSVTFSAFCRYGCLLLLTLLFAACTAREEVSYRIRPTKTRVQTADSGNYSGFQFKEYAGPIVTDAQYARMSPRQRRQLGLLSRSMNRQATKGTMATRLTASTTRSGKISKNTPPKDWLPGMVPAFMVV